MPCMRLQFFEFYQTTIDKWWGRPYLKREFFHRIGSDMGDEVLLVIAEEDGETVAAALNLIGRYAATPVWWLKMCCTANSTPAERPALCRAGECMFCAVAPEWHVTLPSRQKKLLFVYSGGCCSGLLLAKPRCLGPPPSSVDSCLQHH